MEINVIAVETQSHSHANCLGLWVHSPCLLYIPTEGRDFLIHPLGRNNTGQTLYATRERRGMFMLVSFSRGAKQHFLGPSQICLPVG